MYQSRCRTWMLKAARAILHHFPRKRLDLIFSLSEIASLSLEVWAPKPNLDHSRTISSYCLHVFCYFSFMQLSLVKHVCISSETKNIDFTILGFSCVVLSPCPSLPYSPRPQVYSSPLEVIAALWELPQAISRMRLVFNASISLGLSQFLEKMNNKSTVLIIKEPHNILQLLQYKLLQ